MKLMFAPGACSAFCIHVLLSRDQRSHEEPVGNNNLQPKARSISRTLTRSTGSRRVPTLLRDDGSVLTEFPAIAYWLARTNPQAKLLPDDADAQARALEAMVDYVVSTMHMQGFTRIFRPGNFSLNTADEAAADSPACGKEISGAGLVVMDKTLEAKEDGLVRSRSPGCAVLFFMSSSGLRRG